MQTYKFSRDIPIEDSYDLLVAGGGPAGTSAAVCAARLGAKVLLVEATGCLGGMGTSGLVVLFGPMSDGKRMLLGGFGRELVGVMHERGVFGPRVIPDFWHCQQNRWIPFNAEGLKRVLDELTTKAGVEVRFFTRVIDADAGGDRVNGVVLSNIEGYRYIKAKAYIDATGDAVLAKAAGAPCLEVANSKLGISPSTVCSLVAGVDWGHPKYGSDFHGLDAVKREVRQKLVPKGVEDGFFSQPEHFVPGMDQVGRSVGGLNGGHVFNMNPLSCKELSEGMMLGRRLAIEYVEFYRKYVYGCEDMELVATSPVMGVRDSRRIIGEYELSIQDYRARRQFPDQIGVYNRPIGVHPKNTSKEEAARFYREKDGPDNKLNEGDCFGIPYSILVPKGWINLWAAGRCHSSDAKVHGSIRSQSAALLMGQGAGTAAVQHMKTGQPACDLDTARLVETLRQAGAYLPQKSLSTTMTR